MRNESEEACGRMAHQNKMKDARPPFLNSFLTILRNIVFDLLLLHECAKNGLVDRIICTMSQLQSS